MDGDWGRLGSRFRTPLVQHDWLLSCAEAFHADGELAVIAVQEGGELRAAAPLVRLPLAQGGGYELLGQRRLWEPSALLYDGADSLRCLSEALMGLERPLALVRLTRDPHVAAALVMAAAGRGKLMRQRVAPSPFLHVCSSWAEFMSSISSRRRYDLRRARRLLEKNGAVSVDFAQPSRENVLAHLDEAMAVEASGWKGREGSAAAVAVTTADFLRRFCQRAAEAGNLRVSFLRVDGRAVAMQVGVDYADRHWILKIGYDESYADTSPGVQLMHEVVQRVHDMGLSACEFLGSPEPWLQMWTRRARPCRTYSYYPYSLPGGWGYVYRLGIGVTRRLRKTPTDS